MMRLRGLAAALLLLPASGASAAPDRPGRFDFYVLALSWNPSFCRSEGARSSMQCRLSPPKGFVVHGLWPQYERGYPESCPSAEPYRVPRALIDTVIDIMPSPGLVGNEWRKHGTCTGLTQDGYLKLTRDAWNRVTIPKAFARGDARISAREAEEAFVVANPGLSTEGMAVVCDDGQFEEVRICMTRDLEFRRCAEVDRRGCRDRRLQVPAAR